MANPVQDKYTANASMDVTGLTTLSNGAGWLGPKITMVDGSRIADKAVLLHISVTLGTVTVGNMLEVYLVKGDPAGANFDYGASPGANGTTTLGLPTNATAATVRSQLQWLGGGVVEVTTTGSVLKFSILIDRPGPTWALYIYNNTGAALSAASISYETIQEYIS